MSNTETLSVKEQAVAEKIIKKLEPLTITDKRRVLMAAAILLGIPIDVTITGKLNP